MTEEQQDRPEDEKKEPAPVVPAAPTSANYRNLVQWLSDGKNLEWGLEKSKPILSAIGWLGWVVAFGSGIAGFLWSVVWVLPPVAIALSLALYTRWMSGALRFPLADSDDIWKGLKSYMPLALGNIFLMPVLFAISLCGFGFAIIGIAEKGWRIDFCLQAVVYLITAGMSLGTAFFGLLAMNEHSMFCLRQQVLFLLKMTGDINQGLGETNQGLAKTNQGLAKYIGAVNSKTNILRDSLTQQPNDDS